MPRNLNDIIADLPPEEQLAIEARYQILKREVEGLREHTAFPVEDQSASVPGATKALRSTSQNQRGSKKDRHE